MPIRLLCLLLLLCSPAVLAQIDKIEPPHWWTGMVDPQLELMVYGNNIGSAQVSVLEGKARVQSLGRTDNPDILFVQLTLDKSIDAGDLVLKFTGKSREQIRYPIKARQAGSRDRRGFDNRDVIYLITPDRFANGDTNNDSVGILGDPVNRTENYGRHGGDLQGIIDRLDYLASMGFTQLWLNPVVENHMPAWSYHGYAATDLYRIDPRYGTHADYLRLSREAAKRGMGLIQDLVPNHIGNGHPWFASPPARDWFNYAGRFHPTNHMRETVQDPYADQRDAREFADGWFVETMPDLNQRNPHLSNYLIQNAIWWIEEAGLSGLRIDTWPYSDKNFLTQWSRRILAEYPKLNMVGEEWSLEPAIIAYWQAGKQNADGYQNALPSLFDFPLQDALVSALREDENWNTGWVKLYRTLAADGIYADASALTIFADNHDMSRVYTQLNHDPALTRMSLALIATLRGIPQIYYGTEVLMANPNSDSHGEIRGEFPGGWADHNTDAISGKGLNAEQIATRDYMKKLLAWRAQTPALHKGSFRHFAPKDGVYSYLRASDTERVAVLANKNASPVSFAPTQLARVTGLCRRATNPMTGATVSLTRTLTLPAKTVTLLHTSSADCPLTKE